jgi:hypothetical protein
MGYPDHHWLAIGHLAEAAEELLQSWPDMANQVRAHRKRLELDRAYQVPVMDLIAKVGKLGAPEAVPAPWSPPVPHDHTVIEPPPADPIFPSVAQGQATYEQFGPPQATTGCAPCDLRRFAAEQAPRYQAEQQEIGEGKAFSGRLVIITTLGNFDRAYSLVSVIIDQAKAAVLAGLRVDLWVNRGCDLTLAPSFPYGVSVVQAMPAVRHVEDTVQEEDAQLVLAAINPLLDLLAAHGPVRIVAHDLILQSWFVNEAMALHHLVPRAGREWWHLAHSSVNNRLEHSGDPAHPQWLRSHVPQGHRLLAVNASDVQQLAHYYHTTAASIDVLPNSRDPLQVLDLTPEAAAIATAANLLPAEIVQIMPCSADRLLQKGALELVRVFGALAVAGADVRLVFVLCNCRDDKALQQVALVKRAADDAALPIDCLHFSHEILPDSASRGLTQASIRGLFALSNVFAFPTVSEAASLVVWEAMLAGCLMVLNASLPCLMEQLPRSLGLWMAWPSHKAPGQGSPDREALRGLAESIMGELAAPAYQAKRHALYRTSLARYAAALRQALGMPEPGSAP